MDRPTVFAKSLRRGSASTILASVFLIATAFVQAAPEQSSGDALVREVVQHYIQEGTNEYDRGYYASAERMFQMAQKYADRLDPVDQRKLQSLLEKASLAAAERKKALAAKQAGRDLLAKGDVAAARAQFESIQNNPFLNEQERLEIAQMLRTPGTSQTADAPRDNAAPAPAASAGATAGAGTAPSPAPGAATQEVNRVSDLFYQSMLAYHSGDLKKARAGFNEVLKSETLPAPIAETIRGYLAQIDSAEAAGTAVRPASTAAAETVPTVTAASVTPTAMPYRAASEPAAAPTPSETERIQAIYDRSVALYRANNLEEARRGFVEVSESKLLTLPQGERAEDYIATIDKLLSPSTAAPTPVVPATPAERIPLTTAGPDTTVSAGTDGGFVEEINRRRNVIRSHTEAVVNNAVNEAQRYLARGEFDQARDVVFNAQRIVAQYQGQLGDELYRQYTRRLDDASQSITEAQAIRDKQLAEQKRQEAIDAQRDLREQAEVDRTQRVDELMQRAKAYQHQQRYEAALGQLEAILAIDPLNDEALRIKQTLEDTVYLRKQLEMQRLSAKERANILLEGEEAGVPYHEVVTYPKNWREITEKPTRKPEEPIQLDPANVIVYEQLEKVVDLSKLTRDMTLSDAIEIIKNSVEPPLNIVVLWREMLDNAQIDPTTPISMDGLPNAKLGTALENLLDAMSNPQLDIRLDYVVNKGVITVGTDLSLPPKKMETRVYDITDLVGEPANYAQMGSMMGMMGMMGGMGGGMMGGMGGGMGGMGGGMGGMGGGMGGMGGGMGGMGGGMGGMGGGMMGGMGGMGGGMMGGMGGMGGGMGGMGGGMGGMGGGMGGMGGGMMGGMGGMGGGMMGGMGGMGGGMMGGGMGMTGYMSGIMAQSLRYLIEQTIEPDSWFDLSETGEGTITAYPDQQPKKLAIYQTPEVHQQIRDMLDQLRKSLGNQVSIEARFLAVTENFLEDIGLDVDFEYDLGGDWGRVVVGQDSFLNSRPAATNVSGSLGGLGATPAATVQAGYGSSLDDLQVSLLLRATQARTDSKSLSAPKVTVLSGESAFFYLQDYISYALPPTVTQGTQGTLSGGLSTQGIYTPQSIGYIQVGSNLTITPTISKDRKHVLLNVITTQTDLLRFKQHIVSAPIPGTGTGAGNGTAGGTAATAATVLTYPVEVPETETANVMTRVSVPDRGTLLLGGHKITAAVDREAGVPILSKIPILNILFANRSAVRDQKILLVLVKPTIILQEEMDQEAIAAMEERSEAANGL